MAFLDPKARRVIVRVVYDGPAFAGKTTNLEQLRDFFTPMRRGELISPETIAGRTVYFDWMRLDGGLVAGHALRCQLITVPGQAVLSQRRRRILRDADVVVFVCEATVAGVAAGRAMLAGLRSLLAESGRRDVRIVVQANKQDVPAAMPAAELLRALDMPSETPVVGATARSGVGVKETVVLAMRSAATRVQRELLEGTLAESTEARTPEELHAQLCALENEGGEETPALLATIALAELDRRRAEPAALQREVVESIGGGVAAAAPIFVFPSERVESGSVWPAATGRIALREVALSSPEIVSLPGEQPVVFTAGTRRLVTHASWVFPSADEGRAAMVSHVRRRQALGPLRTGSEVVALQEEAGRWRIWRMATRFRTVEQWLERARANRDESLAATALGGLGLGVAEALRRLGRAELRGRVGPRNFGILDGQVLFLDEDDSRREVPLVRALLDPGAGRELSDREFESYLCVVCENVSLEVSGAAELCSELESHRPEGARESDARLRLQAALSRRPS